MASTKTIAFLTEFPADPVQAKIVDMDTYLYDLETTLSVAAKLAEDLMDATTITACKARGEHIRRLLYAADTQRTLIDGAVKEHSEILDSHIEYRIAA